ncbi:MAG TPA: 30S ribosomal protein S20 [bacterium]|nr:30S ribosomal protein S20 [bacterium]
MPIIKSAKKALRVSIAQKAINDVTRAKIKNAVKGVKVAITKGNYTPELLAAAYRELDMAAKKNVVHKNKASRLKSRLAKVVATQSVTTQVKKTKKAGAKKSSLKPKKK